MLATEGLDMMHGVTGVVKESLDCAETWVGRMRAVGVMGDDGDAEVVEERVEEGMDMRTHVRTSTASSSSTSSSSWMTEEYSPLGTPTKSTSVTLMSLESLVNGKSGEGCEVNVDGGKMELDV
jgi:hypothetical protein